MQFQSRVNADNYSVGIAVSPDGKNVYLANKDEGTIFVINTNIKMLQPWCLLEPSLMELQSPQMEQRYMWQMILVILSAKAQSL